MKLHAPVTDLKLEYSPKGDITQFFGENADLYNKWGMLYHNGIDIVRPHGTHMYAIEDATVAHVKDDPSGFGRHIRLISTKPDKDGNCREWVYGHCDKIHVQQNDAVKEGQHIADMGNTGFITSSTAYWKGLNPYAGTHLHLGVRQVKLNVKTGWRYVGSNLPKMEVLNYQNGTKGAIDPVPFLKGSYTGDLPRMYAQVYGIAKVINSIKSKLSK